MADRDISRMAFNVADLFEAAADRVPDREILVCGAERRTYAQLDNRANRLAHYFQSAGIARGQHLGIYGYNSAFWIEAMLAAYKIRAVPINVNCRYVEAELLYLFENGDPRVAPLFLWHLVEEVEHRSSAYLIYNSVVPDRWYRLRVLPTVFSHMLGCSAVAFRGFDKHVPFDVRLAPASELALGWAELRAKFIRPFAR